MKPVELFRRNISGVRHMGGVHSALERLTTGAVQAEDILRAQIVMAVSALDSYVHELVLIGVADIFVGTRPAVDGFNKFRVSLSLAKSNAMSGSRAWVEEEVRKQHGHLTFQQPDKIADAIRLFHDTPLWPSLSARLGRSDRDIRDQLNLIVDRRNKIAHESDMDPSYPGQRWPISDSMVRAAVDFIDTLVEAIDAEVS